MFETIVVLVVLGIGAAALSGADPTTIGGTGIVIFGLLVLIAQSWQELPTRGPQGASRTVRAGQPGARPSAGTRTVRLRNNHSVSGTPEDLTPRRVTALNLYLYLLATYKPIPAPKRGGSKQAGRQRFVNPGGSILRLSSDWAGQHRRSWQYGRQILGDVIRLGLAREPTPGSLIGWRLTPLDEARQILERTGVLLS